MITNVKGNLNQGEIGIDQYMKCDFCPNENARPIIELSTGKKGWICFDCLIKKIRAMP